MIRPPPPRPWTARKTMSSRRLWLKPDIAEPTKKMTMAIWKKRFLP
jgi:hypothetical protein